MNCYFVWCILLDKKSVNVAVSIVLIEQIVIGFSYQQVLGSICFDRLQNHVKNLLVSLDKMLMIQIVRLLTYINDDITIHELNEVGISSSRELHPKILSLVFLKNK